MGRVHDLVATSRKEDTSIRLIFIGLKHYIYGKSVLLDVTKLNNAPLTSEPP